MNSYPGFFVYLTNQSMFPLFLRVLIAWFIFLSIGFSQCVMCKSTVVASDSKWMQLAEAINDGIVYLFAIPYLLALFFGIWWYRQYRKIQKENGKQE